jgi:hypothetical protein
VTSRIGVLIVAAALGGCALHSTPRTGSSVTEASVRSHLDFLASDALNGRGSGTRDEWIAATYAGEQMRRWGIEPLGDGGSYVQAIAIERTELAAPPILSFSGRRLTHGTEVLVQNIGAARTSGPLQQFSPGQTAAAGAVLLVPDGKSWTEIPNALRSAIVLVKETSALRDRWTALGRNLPRLAPRIVGLQAPARPAVVVLEAAVHTAMATLPDGTPVTLEAEIKPPVTTTTWNAMGRLKGSDRAKGAEVILLTAHLDHLGARPGAAAADTIYNGADDDASGCVAVLEIAEALARGPRPKRTIVFTLFGSEESGGYGARWFIEHPPVPLEHIVANLEFEMIGRPDRAVAPSTLWLTGYERTDLGPEMARHGARLVQDPHPEQNFFMRSDNIQLARRGVVAQTVSSYGLHKEYHTPADEVRLVDFQHVTEAIRSMVGPVRWLANSTFRPAWKEGKKP